MSERIPSLYTLRAYEAVARNNSYTKAAKELGITPAAVKQAVVRLEREIGARLVERRGHKIVPTEAGKVGQTDLELAMRFIGDAVRKMRKSKP